MICKYVVCLYVTSPGPYTILQEPPNNEKFGQAPHHGLS
jgi:hypothetical protein